MVGKLPDPEVAPVNTFTRAGLVVALAGRFRPSLAGSELEKLRGGLSDGLPPVDLDAHAAAFAVIREAVRSGLVAAAHDVAEGGLGVALAEMAIPARIGVRADLRPLENCSTEGDDSEASRRASAARNSAGAAAPDVDVLAFGEGPGGVLLACAPEDFDSLAAICADIPFVRLGETGGDQVVLEVATASLSLQVEKAAQAFEEAVASSFG
jgi:phosphoribosylformylglycinamidine synthase